MALPFTVEEFFGVFSDYNQSVWPWQIVLHLLALACIGLMFQSRPASRVISLVLAFFWLWMGIVGHEQLGERGS